MRYERLPLGPVAVLCVIGAVVFAFLRAKYAHEARRHRTMEPPADEEGERPRRRRLAPQGPYYTDEGKRLLRRAHVCGRLFYAFALAALLATWFQV